MVGGGGINETLGLREGSASLSKLEQAPYNKEKKKGKEPISYIKASEKVVLQRGCGLRSLATSTSRENYPQR